jgi:rod shape-determining protein MreD
VRLSILYAIAALAMLGLQTTLAHLIPLESIVPNLTVVLAVDLGLNEHRALGAGIAFAIGYMTDAVAGAHPGLNAFVMVAIFLAAYEISRRLITTNAVLGAAIVFVAAVLSAFAVNAFSGSAGAFAQSGDALFGAMLKAAISAAFAPYVFSLMTRAKARLGITPLSVRE